MLYTTAGAPAAHLGSRLRPLPIQASSGIPDGVRNYVRTLPYNDVELLTEFFDDHGHNEVVLIFDEVKTGFRLGIDGAVGAFGVVPDIATYAKAMGNGFPVAAVALSEKMVEGWGGGGIAQAGTYSGNSVGAAAVKATLERLEDGTAYRHIERIGFALMDGISAVLEDRGVEGTVVGHPAMFSIFMGEGVPTEFRDLTRHDARVYNNMVMAMIERGVAPCPDAREPWFICAAHNDDDVARTLEVFTESLDVTLARAGTLPAIEDD